MQSCKKDDDIKMMYLAHTLPQTHPVHKDFRISKGIKREIWRKNTN